MLLLGIDVHTSGFHDNVEILRKVVFMVVLSDSQMFEHNGCVVPDYTHYGVSRGLYVLLGLLGSSL